MPIRFIDDLQSGTGGPIVPASIVGAPTGATESNAGDFLKNIASSFLAWNFDATTTDASDPGSTNVAINNAAKASATIVTFNTTSAVEAARFDEFLAALAAGDRIFLQERTATDVSALYRVTGAATTTGTRVNVPVASERAQGNEFTDNAVLNVSFFSRGISATQALFLAQLTQTGNVFGFTSNVQIDRDNVEANYRNVIEGATGGQVATDISSLQAKMAIIYALAPDVNILNDWADIYRPSRASQAVNIVQGYRLIADFRGDSDRFESAGVTYTAGSGVVDYSGLSDDLHRSFGFRVSAAADTTLMSITDGATQIPFVDMTAAGNFRVNNFTPARTNAQVVTNHIARAALTAGTGTIAQGGAVSTYTLAGYPANTTSQSRTVNVDFDVLIGGANTLSGGFISVDIPDTDAASTADQDHTFFIGYPYNRSVTCTVRFATRVAGADLVIDISLISAPSDITLLIQSVDEVQDYTTTAIIPRVDDWITLTDLNGDFTFSGSHELLIDFHPIPNTNLTEVVPVVVDTAAGTADQLNDATISIPAPLFDEVQIPDTIQFRTFISDHFLRHLDLVNLLRDRDTKWAYATARLETVTGHAIDEAVDLASGSTLNGTAISTNTAPLEVYQATGTGTGPGELVNLVSLPANYTDYDFVHITERDPGPPIEWRHTVITTHLLNSGDVGSTDLLRLQGNTDLTWTAGTRTITVSDSAQEIYRVVLIDT